MINKSNLHIYFIDFIAPDKILLPTPSYREIPIQEIPKSPLLRSCRISEKQDKNYNLNKKG